ncbi:MAG TPA: type VI secretion system baseplate subunit TssG [Marinagarivorans sp.]
MATTRRRKSLSVIEQLTREPYRFNFYQAVRTIEFAAIRAREADNTVSAPLSLQAPPSQEFLRFNTRQQLSFAAADITKVFQGDNSEAGQKTPESQWQMTVAFMGLTGAQGVLPYHMTEAILRELKNKNTGLHDFLEIFNHRAVTMMYRAWAKYQIPANFETHKIRRRRGNDSATHALLSLMGLGLPSLQYRQPYSDESLIPLSGFLSRGTCTASGLASMIKTRFGLCAEIKQFTGAYSELTPDIMTRLGMQNNALGQSTFLGSRCYSCTGKFTVAIKPNNHEEFDSLAPGTPLVRSLISFIQQAAGPELIFDVDVSLAGERITNTRLHETPEYAPTLGWNTVLGTANQALSSLSVRMSSEITPPDDTLPMAS